MTHGWRRIVFSTDGHSFGVFICYEEIFGDEIRLFVKRGAAGAGQYLERRLVWRHLRALANA